MNGAAFPDQLLELHHRLGEGVIVVSGSAPVLQRQTLLSLRLPE
jgi:hypothetical protein